jgi:hypothetical protein
VLGSLSRPCGSSQPDSNSSSRTQAPVSCMCTQVPLSSRNPELDALFRQKRHILVLNKDDLVPSKLQQVC